MALVGTVRKEARSKVATAEETISRRESKKYRLSIGFKKGPNSLKFSFLHFYDETNDEGRRTKDAAANSTEQYRRDDRSIIFLCLVILSDQ